MKESVLQNCTGVIEEPFPHVNIPSALSEDLYKELYETLPPWQKVARDNSNASGDNQRINHFTDVMQHYSETWRDFIDYHVSNEFYQEFIHWFGPYIREYLPGVERKYGPLEDIPVKEKLGKDKTKWGPLGSHILLGVYLPTSKATVARDAHLDKTDHLTSGLLYMADPDDNGGGALQLYKCEGKPEHGAWVPEASHIVKGKNVQFPVMESVAEVPYEANRYACFLQTSKSVHSVGLRKATTHARRFVGISFIFDDHIRTNL